MMKSPLDQIEKRIKELFEHGSVVLPWMDDESVFLHHISEAIHSSFANAELSDDFSPSCFTFFLCPQDAIMIERDPNWHIAFLSIINEIAVEYNIRLEKKPEIKLKKKNSLAPTEVRVKIGLDNLQSEKTNAIPINVETAVESALSINSKASLLLENESIFPLELPVINIGRKSTNHLVIDDLRVSRNHAQIRALENGFMIFDTGSSGGTYVNGERITQRQLKPGDVISIGGIKLIFTQELNTQPDTEKKQITSELNSVA